MNELELKFPWCTGAPRPTLLSNMDVGEVIVSYYTAPICVEVCSTAIIIFSGVSSIKHEIINDIDNIFIKAGAQRDSLNVIEENGSKKYVLFFHNEYVAISAKSYDEVAGKDSVIENINWRINADYKR